MGFVLFAALGLAALRSATKVWVGTMFLLTCVSLGFAILNAVYSRGERRAWWLGFSILGWTWLIAIATRAELSVPTLPASGVLLAFAPYLGHPGLSTPATPEAAAARFYYLLIGHDLFALVFGFMGGMMGRVVFTRSSDRDILPEPEMPPIASAPRKWWLRPVLSLWLAAVLGASIAALRSSWNAGLWVGVTFLLTWGLMCLFIVGAIGDRSRRRAAWLGGGVLGGGYLLLTLTHPPQLPLPTNQLLAVLRRWLPEIAGGTAAANARIYDALERPVAMTFPDPTPISEVLRYVTLATATPNYAGIPIYLDPIALQQAEQTSSSPVTIDLINAPLKASLHVCLKPLGLTYEVKDGLLQVRGIGGIDASGVDTYELIAGGYYWTGIEPARRAADLNDPFLIVGHCLLALLAAAIGAIVSPLVADSSVRGVSSPPSRSIE